MASESPIAPSKSRAAPPVTLLRLKRPRFVTPLDALHVTLPQPKRQRLKSSLSLAAISLHPSSSRNLRFRRLPPAARAAALAAADVTVVDVPLDSLRVGGKRARDLNDARSAKAPRLSEEEPAILCNGEEMEKEYDLFAPEEEGAGITEAGDTDERESETDPRVVGIVAAEDLPEFEEESEEESEGSVDPDAESVDYPNTPESSVLHGSDESSDSGEGRMSFLGNWEDYQDPDG